VVRNQAVKLSRVGGGVLPGDQVPRQVLRRQVEVPRDLPDERQRVLVRGRVVVRHARKPRVHVAPPSSSAVTSCPVAAFTSGGPPMKIVPVPRTMIVSSLIAGTYAPPAVHEPITDAICGIPAAERFAWLKKIRPK